jgi:ABC-type oligopeptide transport system ATPase subunit
MTDVPLLDVRRLSRIYRRGGLFSATRFAAVDDVSLTLSTRPQVFAIVGESGSGKTTLARMILRLVAPSTGEVRLMGRPLARGDSRRQELITNFEFRRLVQPIFQNPFEAFSAYLPIDTYLIRTALNLKMAPRADEAIEVADRALRSVGLSFDRIRGKYIRQFSGGELQRISIARALIPNPRLIVADEPVSMVDASLRMNIVNVFGLLKDELNVSFIYITHDLSTVYYLADFMVIMNRGRIVDQGRPQDVLANPREDYTRDLVKSVPGLDEPWPEVAAIKHAAHAGARAEM